MLYLGQKLRRGVQFLYVRTDDVTGQQVPVEKRRGCNGECQLPTRERVGFSVGLPVERCGE